MKTSGLLLCLVFGLPHLPAQAVATPETGTEKPADKTNQTRAQQEQRRNALRSALAQRKRSDDAIEAKLVDRHLTARERDEMRQQLRQQRREAELAKP